MTTIPDHEAGQGALPVTGGQQIPPEWTDDNGHMNEAHYLTVAAGATDGFLAMIGAGPAYVASGKSYFTVETHIRYLAEVRAGDRLTVTTQILNGAEKRLHLFHHLRRDDGMLAATVETLLLHTDLTTRRTCPPDPSVARTLASLAEKHLALPAEGCGRFVGQRALNSSEKQPRPM